MKKNSRYFVMMVFAFFCLFSFVVGDAFASQPHPWQMGLQPSVTPVMDRITHLHDILLYIILIIGVVVTILILYTMWRYSERRNPVASKVSHHTLLEIVWTAIPTIILLIIMIPSVKLLYFSDKVAEAEVTLKVTGHQWYWSYEYPDEKIGFDSLMIEDKDLKPGQLRLLEVDNRVIVPVDTNVRVLITSADVLHSWAVPSFGVKKDSVPGKLVETWFNARKEGVYYGQCSELCGMKHGFMPIAVEVVSKEKYKEWLAQAKQKFAQ